MSYVVSEPSAPPKRPAGGSLDTLRGHIGAAARAQRAAALDAWLAGMFPSHLPGVSLIAVGGLGRRDCAPYSDLDLVLLHNGQAGIDRIASSLWYPIWDAKLGLDHSVRTLPEALSVAHDDVKVSLGLLDARHIAGDAKLSAELDHRRRRPVAAHRGPADAPAQGADRGALGGARRTRLPARGRPQGSGRRAARRHHPARHRPGRGGRHHAPRGARRQPAAARHPRRPAPRGRPAGGPAGRPGTAGRRRAARPGGRRRAAAPGRRRRPDRRARPGRRLARGGPAAQRPPPGCARRCAGAPAGRPRRGRAGRRAGARAYRHRPGPGPQPVAAGGGRGGHRPAADRPRHQRMARGLLPAAAHPVAAGRPGRAGLAARLRARACCPPGRPATGTG